MLLILRPVSGLAQQAFACPANLKLMQQPQAPPGWVGLAVSSEHVFKTAAVYNGEPGKAEYELKPDNESGLGRKLVLSWRLKDYRDMNLFVRCYYRDSSATVTASLPSRLTSCSVFLEMNAKNEIVGRSRMTCQ